MKPFLRFVLIACMAIAAFLPASARGATLERFEYAQLLMGVEFRIAAYAPSESAAREACTAAFARVAALEEIMSDYRPKSELMQLCARAGGPPAPVSADLFLILQRARELSARSEGAFDVTAGPYITLWRKARKSGQFPAADALRQAGACCGWQKMLLDPKARTVQLLVPGMRLDLGGIAKGYACDCALQTLRAHGIRRALIQAGGEIRVGDPPPGQKGWRIDNSLAAPEGQSRTILAANKAISTSGDTAQFVVLDGRRYSHIVDPRTGIGLTNRIAVTVIAPDGLTADSLSTAVSVLGAERGAALVRTYPGASFSTRYLKEE